MTRRRLKILLPAAVVLVGALAWWLHPRPTDQELIAQLMLRGKHGIETKNVGEVMDCVAPDYQDSQNVTRTELLRMVMQWPRVPERGEVRIDSYQLNVTPPTAQGKFEITFTLTSENGTKTPMPMTLTIQFEKTWRRWHHVWLVKSAEGYSTGGMMEGIE